MGFTGTLVSAGGMFSRRKNKKKEMKDNKYGALNDDLKDTKRNAAETNALLEETYKNSVNKSIVNSMIMKKNDDQLYRDIINIETQKISGKVKNKRTGSDYKMNTRPATTFPTKENIAQSKKKELKKRNAAENNSKDLKGFYK